MAQAHPDMHSQYPNRVEPATPTYATAEGSNTLQSTDSPVDRLAGAAPSTADAARLAFTAASAGMTSTDIARRASGSAGDATANDPQSPRTASTAQSAVSLANANPTVSPHTIAIEPPRPAVDMSPGLQAATSGTPPKVIVSERDQRRRINAQTIFTLFSINAELIKLCTQAQHATDDGQLLKELSQRLQANLSYLAAFAAQAQAQSASADQPLKAPRPSTDLPTGIGSNEALANMYNQLKYLFTQSAMIAQRSPPVEDPKAALLSQSMPGGGTLKREESGDALEALREAKKSRAESDVGQRSATVSGSMPSTPGSIGPAAARIMLPAQPNIPANGYARPTSQSASRPAPTSRPTTAQSQTSISSGPEIQALMHTIASCQEQYGQVMNAMRSPAFESYPPGAQAQLQNTASQLIQQAKQAGAQVQQLQSQAQAQAQAPGTSNNSQDGSPQGSVPPSPATRPASRVAQYAAPQGPAMLPQQMSYAPSLPQNQSIPAQYSQSPYPQPLQAYAHAYPQQMQQGQGYGQANTAYQQQYQMQQR
ncbi:uncharacterized protein L969DRAFT_250792 [Mixia osmundae IAM 14324]|uniref:Uncharacterized protein n=1 Tax=Mixia osmundae (strain CBS 9802 / IAM 14324 / JCM 22182 / KY 12970) TaxID=764103 RepID=G7E1M6_MIXOS|nr:uncharacterized protein L969DRAFT_250792 [Mixia osmundae IAM 14324]KEI36686.1 hypothetical protein L969DRAFT_250792 [Mixia osmundae IAM 14324]GAA96736.1 hypothetical protein E5Q_03407 [Mixia osmundae IAM 14324]